MTSASKGIYMSPMVGRLFVKFSRDVQSVKCITRNALIGSTTVSQGKIL